jgi:phosphatidate cytidylyltransferase
MSGEGSPPQAPAAAAGLHHALWQDLGARTLSAVVLIPAVILDVWLGGVWFEVFMALIGVLIAYEWCNMVHARSAAQFALHAGAALVATFLPRETGLLPAAGVVLMLTAVGTFASSLREGEKTFWTYAGIPYAAFPVMAFVALRNDPAWGLHAILWLLIVVWATDTCAYFSGRLVGGPKLAPRFSPGKTWAGLAGGMAGAFLLSALFALALQASVLPLALAAAILAVVAQLGDIGESALKRHYGVKDSGDLIPGHGGMMDRLDGLLAAGVAAALVGFVRQPEALAHGLLFW